MLDQSNVCRQLFFMNRQLNLRLLTPADLPFADSLRALVGWNQTIRDWQRFLALQPDGCFLAEWDGSPAGTATTICYGTDLAWIGMVLVHPDYRGRGIGTALLQHCIDFLRQRQVRCIKLDATPQGQPLYTSLGFCMEWPLSRWESAAKDAPGASAPTSAPDAPSEHPLPLGGGEGRGEGVVRSATSSRDHGRVRPLENSDWEIVTQLDAQTFGVARLRLLEELAKQSACVLVHESSHGQVTGFGMFRPGSRAAYLGPVVAVKLSMATELITTLMNESPSQNVFWDIPDDNSDAKTLATKLGFKVQRPLLRMYLGENKFPGDRRLQFAIADPSLG